MCRCSDLVPWSRGSPIPTLSQAVKCTATIMSPATLDIFPTSESVGKPVKKEPRELTLDELMGEPVRVAMLSTVALKKQKQKKHEIFKHPKTSKKRISGALKKWVNFTVFSDFTVFFFELSR